MGKKTPSARRQKKQHRHELKRKRKRKESATRARPEQQAGAPVQPVTGATSHKVSLGPKPPGREISPAVNATVEEYTQSLFGLAAAPMIRRMRQEKVAGIRPRPSQHLHSTGDSPNLPTRRKLLDKVAALVDENASGRSDMCRQFAVLMKRALVEMGFDAKSFGGRARYNDPDGGGRPWEWNHAWVQYGDPAVVVDGNVDTMNENPLVPFSSSPTSYWGPAGQHPDRSFMNGTPGYDPGDSDIDQIWWPDLKQWLVDEVLVQSGGK